MHFWGVFVDSHYSQEVLVPNPREYRAGGHCIVNVASGVFSLQLLINDTDYSARIKIYQDITDHGSD